MEDCQLKDVKMDSFEFEWKKDFEGFWDETYDGLLMTHRSTGRIIFFDFEHQTEETEDIEW